MDSEYIVKNIILSKGESILLRAYYDNYVISAITADGKEIGKFEFKLIDDFDSEYLMVCYMYLEGANGIFKRRGLGRNILKFAREIFDLPITAAENDGLKRDDGCHLTGNGPAFIEKMIEEGIIYSELRHEFNDKM